MGEVPKQIAADLPEGMHTAVCTEIEISETNGEKTKNKSQNQCDIHLQGAVKLKMGFDLVCQLDSAVCTYLSVPCASSQFWTLLPAAAAAAL